MSQWLSASPLYIFGDASALAFTNLWWEQSGSHWLTRVAYEPELHFLELSQEEHLHPGVVQLLLDESLIAPIQASTTEPNPLRFEAIHRSNTAFADYFQQGVRASTEPILLLVFGDTHGLQVSAEFALPMDLATKRGIPESVCIPAQVTADWKEVYEQIHIHTHSAVKGLKSWAEMGFSKLFLRAFPLVGTAAECRLRILLNSVLADWSQSEPFVFLEWENTWHPFAQTAWVPHQQARQSLQALFSHGALNSPSA